MSLSERFYNQHERHEYRMTTRNSAVAVADIPCDSTHQR